MAGEENAAWEGERGGKARDTHHVREFHLRGSADVRLCEERGGSWADGQPGASRGTDTFWFWTRVSFFWRANAAGEASSAGGGVRWGPNGARGWFVGGCTHVIDPRHDVQDLSARLAALAACARSVTRKIPEVESAAGLQRRFLPLWRSAIGPKDLVGPESLMILKK